MRFTAFIILLLISLPCFAQNSKYLFIPYTSNELFSETLNEQMSKDTRLQLIPLAEGVTAPSFPADGVITDAYKQEIAEILKKADITSAITGFAVNADKVIKITTICINSSAEQTYSSILYVNPEDKEYNTAFDITGRIKLFEDKKIFPVKTLTAGAGTSYLNTPVTWETVPECSAYGIFRSKTKDGIYLSAGISDTNSFKDTTAEPGFRYYYSIAPFYNGIRTELSDPVPGYRKPPVPQDKNFKKLIGSFNKPKPKLKGDALTTAHKHEAMLKDIYFNKVKLNIMLYMSRSYIEKKELFVYNGFTDFQIDKDKRHIDMLNPKIDADFFYDSNTFFAKIVNLGDDELVNTLLRNAVLFCVPSGEKEKQLENGEVQYIPVMEVASLCTQYYNECREWPETTLVFATKNKALREKMEQAKQKNESQE
jgi:hypothetical protein